MQVSEGYRIAKRLQQLQALGTEQDRVLVVRTVINQLTAEERDELARLVDRCNNEVLTPKQCSASEKRIIRAVIQKAGEYPRLCQAELDERAARAAQQQQRVS